MNKPEMRAEMTKELRSARNYLIGVGLLMVAMDMLFLHVLRKDEMESDVKNIIMCFDIFVLGLFFALAYFVPRAPRFCLVAGLVLFWLLQIGAAYDNPRVLFTQGILVKIFFTMALWKGLQSASKAQVMKRDLERVFE